MTDEGEILFALIHASYAARLDAAQLDELRKTVDGILRDVVARRAAAIPDDAEPAQPFVPFVATPRAPTSGRSGSSGRTSAPGGRRR